MDLIPQESYSSDTQTNEVKVANVAVKVMNNQTTQEDRISFLQEAVLMGQFTDPNVVAIFGIVTMTSRVSLGHLATSSIYMYPCTSCYIRNKRSKDHTPRAPEAF